MKNLWLVISLVVGLGVGVAIGVSVLTAKPTPDAPDADKAEIRRLTEENDRLSRLREASDPELARIGIGKEEPAVAAPPTPEPAGTEIGEDAGEDAPAAPSGPVDGGPLGFSDWKDGALRGIDWDAVGESIVKINPLVVEVARDVAKGRRPSGPTIATIQKENGKVLEAALAIHDRVGGGDAVEYFSDPAVMANAMATTLRAAGLPLTPAQADALTRTARYWTEKLDRLRESWDESTLKLTKLGEAAALKDRFFTEAFRELSMEQVETLNPSETRDRIRLTVFSSAHHYAMRTRVIPFADTSEIEAPLFGGVAYELRLTEEERARAKEVYDDWFAGLSTDLLQQESTVLDLRGHPTAQRVTAWALEEAELLGRILSAVPLDVERNERARQLGVIGVPVRKTAD